MQAPTHASGIMRRRLGRRNAQPLPLRDIRRSESNYERARNELAESAIARSLAFAATTRRTSASCASIPFDKAFRVKVKVVESAPTRAEIGRPLRGLRTSTAALLPPPLPLPMPVPVRSAAATPSCDAASSDVVLQPPLLREQPARNRYTGQLFIAEGGTYELGEIFRMRITLRGSTSTKDQALPHQQTALAQLMVDSSHSTSQRRAAALVDQHHRRRQQYEHAASQHHADASNV